MKKVSYLELSALFLAIITAFNSGINIYILKNDVGIDSWMAMILTYVLGFIFLMMTMFIANYQPDLNIFEKITNLFGKLFGNLINIFIYLILFMIALTLLYNITSFITTQFLYHTPMIISSILLVSLAVYASTKEINVICHVSFILSIINIVIFIICTSSLTRDINLEYLLPFLKSDKLSLITSAVKLTIINVLPMIVILVIPKDNITNKKKYNRTIIITYIIGSIMSFIMVTGTISTLGIYLVKTFEYSEYIVLKKVRLFGFLERIENVASIGWITSVYIYLMLIIYGIAKGINNKPVNNKKKFIITNLMIGLFLVILSNYIFKSITIFNNYLTNIFIYVVMLLLPIYLIILGMIFLKRK